MAVSLVGVSGSLIEVEADLGNGLPTFVLIGLPDTALGEARDRVRSAATNAGCPLPNRKTTVNLSPASLPKQGTGFDLAIALSVLVAAGEVPAETVAGTVHIGELGLDGRLRPVTGILPAVLAAQRAGALTVMVPSANAEEAELVPGIRVVGVPSLLEAAIWHGGEYEAVPVESVKLAASERQVEHSGDLAEVVGNPEAAHAMIVAAAGGHHCLLLGPPGSGKSMLASRLPGLLPDLDDEQSLELSSIQSVAGLPLGGRLSVRPPFESPHHTATAASIVGGGSRAIRPGAAARASHGILFLDEATEFSPHVLDSLRQPLESGTITIHRASAVAHFPARFQLVLAANPCQCGLYGTPGAECTCPVSQRRRYLGRLSGPLLDRVDIHLGLRPVTAAQLRLGMEQPGRSTAEARAAVVAARKVAAARLSGTPWRINAQVSGAYLRSAAMVLPAAVTAPLDRALERGSISMRGYDRTIRVAWTVADLAGVPRPGLDEVGQALYLRKGMS